jgi:hypothetical protein
MSSTLQIEDVVEPQSPIVYTELIYDIYSITPNTCAKISATLFTKDKEHRKDYLLELSQPEYSNWGTDDSFIQDWVLAQLNVVIKPSVIEEISIPIVNE